MSSVIDGQFSTKHYLGNYSSGEKRAASRVLAPWTPGGHPLAKTATQGPSAECQDFFHIPVYHFRAGDSRIDDVLRVTVEMYDTQTCSPYTDQFSGGLVVYMIHLSS